MSLREEELNRSLQTVDTNLIQARAALEAAYMEVQRLMVVKQQVCLVYHTMTVNMLRVLCQIDLLLTVCSHNYHGAFALLVLI